MSKIFYEEPQKEKIGAEEIFKFVLSKDSLPKYSLPEFSSEILKKISAFEKEPGRYYIRCLKREKDIFIYDKNKKTGDGKHNIFKHNSLDARDWSGEQAEEARTSLKSLLLKQDEENKKTYRYLIFDLLMTNPPFAGEITDSGLLRQYEFAKKNGKLRQKVERHLLFKDNSGEYIFVNEKGHRVKSEAGIFESSEKIKLDDDLNEIAEAFIKFAKDQKFNFWREYGK